MSVPDVPAQLLPPGTKACIIGAGCSGLTAAKALSDRGLPYDQYEIGSDIGGNWRYNNDNGRSSAYRTLHIISSKWNMAFEDYPMPDDFPAYGHHRDVLQYFEDYADAFDLRSGITFNTQVKRVAPTDEGLWCVTLDDGSEHTYGAVLSCSGHHWNPRYPDFPGTFSGTTQHSHHYRTPEDLSDERVLIVGIGNSACDIAIDLCRLADKVTISTRSSAWILPKYLLGIPTDQWTSPMMERLPYWMRRPIFRLLVWMTVGNQERYGLRKPEHGLMEEHPTLNQELLSYIGHGRVQVKPNVERLEGEQVRFEDGSIETFDHIIYATGYAITHPFLPDHVFTAEDNRVTLYGNVVPPEQPGLYFIGLLQPLGAIMPLSEKQSKWVAALLNGEAMLPDADTMRRDIEARQAAIEARYTASPRHTIQCDFWTYVRRMEQVMRDGRKRARRHDIPRRSDLAGDSAEVHASMS